MLNILIKKQQLHIADFSLLKLFFSIEETKSFVFLNLSIFNAYILTMIIVPIGIFIIVVLPTTYIIISALMLAFAAQ